MSNCLCLACDRANPITTKFCTQCGARLQIQDRYRALRVIGQGGFGKTFLAQDESKPSHPRCVIKQFAFETINPNASQGDLDIAVRLFEQEAKRLDDLGKHPQIPELLSFTIHEGKQYLIQEFIDGETLEQELRRVNAFSEQQVRDVLVEVLQILEFVHSKSVIHRDISPDNIIRRKGDGKLVLVDFGAAKHATATILAKTGTGIGKPSYGAPEQMLGKSVFQSDLFGLGVTCLHLLTNVEPFTLYDVLENEYQWRQFLNGKVVSDGFGKLLDRMTAYRVKERPNSVMDILQEFVDKKVIPSRIASRQVQNSNRRLARQALETKAKEYLNSALAKKNEGNIQGAISDLTEAINLNPYEANAYRYRALAKNELGDHQGAIADYSKAIHLSPDVDNYYDRGDVKQSIGDKEGAITDFTEVIRLKPEHTMLSLAYYMRGLQKSDLEDETGAIADFTEAIRLKPDFDQVFVNRGLSKSELEDIRGAIADFSEAIQLNPNNTQAYNYRGDKKKKSGDYQGAIADYKRVISIMIMPSKARDYFQRGRAKEELGDNKGALNDYIEAIRLTPNDATSYLNMGELKKDLGDRQGGRIDIEKAAELYKQQGEIKMYDICIEILIRF
jgi:serine/threonine protein kinase